MADPNLLSAQPIFFTVRDRATFSHTVLTPEQAFTSQTEPGSLLFIYAPPVRYESGGPASALLVADVNKDGNLDTVVANCGTDSSCSGKGSINVLLGKGDGTFYPAQAFGSGGSISESAAIADVNTDGKLDAVLTNLCFDWPFCRNSGVGVLLGNGDGTFQPATTYSSGALYAESVTVADINSDGKLDLVVANCNFNCSGSGSVGVLLGRGDGTFGPATLFTAGQSGAWSIAVRDVNGDGKPDAVVGGLCPSRQCNDLVTVLLGNGDGTFLPGVTYSSGDPYLTFVAIADVNSNGSADILVSGADAPVGVLFGNGDGTFQPVVPYEVYGWPATLQDVNGDTHPDLVVSSTGAKVLLGNGDGTFGSAVTYDAGYGGVLAAIGDVNGDGKPDLVVNEHDGSGVLLNNGGAPPTTTSLTSDVNPVTVNQSVAYTAKVTSQSGSIPSGNVFFLESFGGQQPVDLSIGTPALQNGHATLSQSYNYIRVRPITAVYSGEFGKAAGSISNVVIENTRGTSTTSIRTSKTPALLTELVTFTAKVASKYGAIPDGGLVVFSDGVNPLNSVALVGGMAQYTTSSLTAGAHSIRASYADNNAFVGSTGSVREFIIGHSTSTTFASSLNPATYGQAVSWTATVSGSPTPTGSVAFTWSRDGQKYTLGTARLNSSGVATLTKSNLNADPFGTPYPLIAVYSGDAVNSSSTSSVLSQTVLQARSAAHLSSSESPAIAGQPVKFTAKITSPTVVPTGPVTFSLGSTVLGTAQLTRGTATFTTSALPRGANVVKATYSGSSNIARCSASIVQTIE